MISCSRSSSCFCRSITDSMMARSSGVRCERSGPSSMLPPANHHTSQLPYGQPVSSAHRQTVHLVRNKHNRTWMPECYRRFPFAQETPHSVEHNIHHNTHPRNLSQQRWIFSRLSLPLSAKYHSLQLPIHAALINNKMS